MKRSAVPGKPLKQLLQLWKQNRPTGMLMLHLQRLLLRDMGVDCDAVAGMRSVQALNDYADRDQRLRECLALRLGYHARAWGEVPEGQRQQELVGIWVASRMGDRPNILRMGEDFTRQLLATDPGKAVVSDLQMPFSALVLEPPPGIEFVNRYTGLHPLQALAVIDGEVQLSLGAPPVRALFWLAYCGARPDSASPADDNYQTGIIPLAAGPEGLWTFKQAFEAVRGSLQEEDHETWELASSELGGTLFSERRSIQQMARAVERLLLNALLYLSQERPSLHRTSDGKPTTVKELVEAPERTRVRLRKKGLLGFRFDLGKDEADDTVRYAYKTLVRGHWRSQPYGKGHLLRRPVWIKPHVRHKDAPGEAAAHDYEHPR